MKIAIIDTYYPEFLKSLPVPPISGMNAFESVMTRIMERQFGTADFYSREFRKLGHWSMDIIANDGDLQSLWGRARGHIGSAEEMLSHQIKTYQPDVLFLQDLSIRIPDDYGGLVVGQCSSAINKELEVDKFRTIFTSFPHYSHKFKNAIYMPLAFHESTLRPEVERDIDCLFVGGIGWQWNYGRMVLEKVAAEIPGAQFYGYGFDSLPDGPLKQKYRGHAWGDEMYALMQRAKVVINRHGEISGSYANNMRMYEATGSGALLVTENKENMNELFRRDEVLTYSTPAEAVERIQSALNNWNTWGKDMAAAGQKRTLTQHTYAHRVPQIAKILDNAMATA